MEATAIIWLILYFIPTLIAAIRHHHNGIPIFIVNILLGWTILGWIAALVWSCTAVKPELQATPGGTGQQKTEFDCPYCYGSVSPGATKCPNCGEWIKQKAQEALPLKKEQPQKPESQSKKGVLSFLRKSKYLKTLGDDSDE